MPSPNAKPLIRRVGTWGGLSLAVIGITAAIYIASGNLSSGLERSRQLVSPASRAFVNTAEGLCTGKGSSDTFQDLNHAYANFGLLSNEDGPVVIEEVIVKNPEALDEVAIEGIVLTALVTVEKLGLETTDLDPKNFSYLWDGEALPVVSGRGGKVTVREVVDTLVSAALSGNCSWHLAHHPAGDRLILWGYVLAEATRWHTIYEWVLSADSSYAAKILPQMGYRVSYHELHNSQGMHYLVLTQNAGPKTETALELALWVPDMPAQIFIHRIILFVQIGWAVLVLLLGSMIVWRHGRSLRMLEQAVQGTGEILTKEDSVSSELHNLAERLPEDTDALRTYRATLRDMSSLLDEREQWLNEVLHDFYNEFLALDFNLQKFQERIKREESITTEPLSSLSNLGKITVRLRTMLLSLTEYQNTLYGHPEEKFRIDLDSILKTIVDETEDIGGTISYSNQYQVHVDGQMKALERAFRNLIQNAHHHGGEVHVRTLQTEDSHKVTIVIDDDGPGIATDEIDEIFKPYRKGRGSTMTNKSSSWSVGLGLTIAFRVIKDHGGKIHLANRLDDDGQIEGLRVRVVLPVI